jgi:hypothetical protein
VIVGSGEASGVCLGTSAGDFCFIEFVRICPGADNINIFDLRPRDRKEEPAKLPGLYSWGDSFRLFYFRLLLLRPFHFFDGERRILDDGAAELPSLTILS